MGKGSGGGGSSGKVEWPAYFQTWHTNLLGDSSGLAVNVITALNSSLNDNPFVGATPYDPTTPIAAMITAIDDFDTLVSALNASSEWHDAIVAAKAVVDDHLSGTTELVAAEAAFNDVIDADYDHTALPRFQRGMQDVNAVVSSSYVIGKALLEAEVTRKKAQFSSELRLQNYRDTNQAVLDGVKTIFQRTQVINDLSKQIVNTQIEVQRLKIVAMKEFDDAQMKLDEAEVKWELDILSYGGNLLAAGHGTVSSGTTKATPIQSAIGGALSGAAVGGMAAMGMQSAGMIAAGMGPIGWGIGIGAALGGALGLFG